MAILKIFIKQAISCAIGLLAGNKVGAYTLTTIVNRLMEDTVKVSYKGTEMLFSIPNILTRYRATSFSTKEPDTLTWLESIPSDVVLWDVGANVGLYSVYAAKLRGVRVFAFEPSVFNLELLARNIFLNELQNCVTVIPVALSDALGPSMFKLSSTAWGGALSTFGQDFDQHGGKLNSIFEYQTMGMTMDQAILLLNIPAPRFIKIDVDGIEHFILRGGTEALKGVESVMIEVDDGFAEQAEETARHLQNAGLRLLRKSGGDAGSQYNQWWVRGSA
jgi:FkbM family methyltransferase